MQLTDMNDSLTGALAIGRSGGDRPTSWVELGIVELQSSGSSSSSSNNNNATVRPTSTDCSHPALDGSIASFSLCLIHVIPCTIPCPVPSSQAVREGCEDDAPTLCWKRVAWLFWHVLRVTPALAAAVTARGWIEPRFMQDAGYILAMSDVESRRQRRQLLTSDSIGFHWRQGIANTRNGEWVPVRGGFFCGVQLLIQLADVIRDWGYSWLFWKTQLALVLPTDGDNLIDPLAGDSLAASQSSHGDSISDPPSDAVLDFNPASWLIYLSRCHMKFTLYGSSVLEHSAHLRMHPIRPSMLDGRKGRSTTQEMRRKTRNQDNGEEAKKQNQDKRPKKECTTRETLQGRGPQRSSPGVSRGVIAEGRYSQASKRAERSAHLESDNRPDSPSEYNTKPASLAGVVMLGTFLLRRRTRFHPNQYPRNNSTHDHSKPVCLATWVLWGTAVSHERALGGPNSWSCLLFQTIPILLVGYPFRNMETEGGGTKDLVASSPWGGEDEGGAAGDLEERWAWKLADGRVEERRYAGDAACMQGMQPEGETDEPSFALKPNKQLAIMHLSRLALASWPAYSHHFLTPVPLGNPPYQARNVLAGNKKRKIELFAFRTLDESLFKINEGWHLITWPQDK
ncbi:uncharacterized protein BO96DRAFT_391068 [Aspergillus niger CBS 101883]|uniref:uncharacterized protein n=1 Tax=Aspergillus lacticoffeatus (strain CBS 101883) TaxID=1450533 RepID=UPI000D7EFE21|nr:uncharacterized protein BO96DRAFT_391068 [Aspergillus niger CBS 101883]PYH57696.1 hypothetical protein BO96DRAFT_391068 [Aspergillus niger CBS 101883]